jgi:Protein of unknown function (DUF3631)
VTLAAELDAIDDAPWSEWRGLRDDQQPRRLSPGELAKMLAPFGIRPRTIWPLGRTPGSNCAKGYHRSQFEAAWRSYASGTPSQASNPKHLRSV